MAIPDGHHLPTSPRSVCTSSNGHPLCRICQSETGVMVRPCACAGTMADIHQNCLNEWVSRSRSQNCEICKESYALSSKRLRPIKEWSKPKLTLRMCVALASLACLITSLINIYFISVERKFFERVFVRGYSIRSGDSARLVLAAILVTLIVCIFVVLYKKVGGYFARQRIVHFIDNPNQGKE